jgi:acyl dehydratase
MAGSPVRRGDTMTSRRLISPELVVSFGDLVGDRGEQHDSTGGQPAVVHGLLVASLPFAVMADFGFVGDQVQMSSSTPAFAGSTLITRVEITDVAPHGRCGHRVRLSFRVEDERGRSVLIGESTGVVPADG